MSEHVQGSKGRADVSRHTILGADQWRYTKQDADKDPYQQEHDDLFNAIRNNKEYNEAFYGATSTMTSIIGRMAAYSGKELEWDAALASKIEVFPFHDSGGKIPWDAAPGAKPGPDGYYPKPIPGKTVVI